jgi:co-chaperonin GroES (HSP10)
MKDLVNIKGTFRPLQDWLLLQPREIKTEIQVGGIYLPQSDDRMRSIRIEADVIAAGPLAHRDGVKVGDVASLAGHEQGESQIMLNGKVCYLMRSRHCNLLVA